MRALLLAAGMGTRLGAKSLNTPKCLQNVGGRPILARLIDQLRVIGVTEILVNTHHHAGQIEGFIRELSGTTSCKTVFEPNLLGTLGTLQTHAEWLKNDTSVVLHADNYIEGNLQHLLDAHAQRPQHVIASLLTFDSTAPEECGIVECDANNIVLAWHEKANHPPGKRASAATYIFEPQVFETAQSISPIGADISRDLMPLLVGQLLAVQHDRRVIDIGSPSRLATANTWAFSGSQD